MSVRDPQAGRGRTAIVVAAAVIVAVVAVAWALQTGADESGESPAGDSPLSYTVTVRRGGEVLKEYDVAALRALPQASLVIAGKEQDGPLLRTVLDDAGADALSAVDIVGAGIRDEGRLTLTATEVDRDVQLDFADRGTVKVCADWLARGEWVRDVVSIDAR